MEQSRTDPQKQILEEARERARENHLAQENDRVHTSISQLPEKQTTGDDERHQL